MKFEVDNQTLRDLEIFQSSGQKTVISLFDSTQCLGGKNRLYQMLANPLSDLSLINERKDAISFFQHNAFSLHLDKDALDFAEFYLRHSASSTRIPSRFVAWERRLMNKINPNNDYFLVEKGVTSMVELLRGIYRFVLELEKTLSDRLSDGEQPQSALVSRNNRKILAIFSEPAYKDVVDAVTVSAYDIARFDYLFRTVGKDNIDFFLQLIYEYDALTTVAKTASSLHLSYCELVHPDDTCLEVEALFHPFLERAIACDVSLGNDLNLMFVSGPNMAGKSTFLKALGLAVYLSHVGFPVPAQRMKMSMLSGLFTTINVTDNLSSGYSHFYAEVMRIKNVATKLYANPNPNMLVIFDELFRGTNVKDAYDGTLSVVSAFSQIKRSFFVISSHIVEAAKDLSDQAGIKFGYFEIIEQNGYPLYTYRLKEGISDVRLGMYIIKKEGLIELINNISKQ